MRILHKEFFVCPFSLILPLYRIFSVCKVLHILLEPIFSPLELQIHWLRSSCIPEHISFQERKSRILLPFLTAVWWPLVQLCQHTDTALLRQNCCSCYLPITWAFHKTPRNSPSSLLSHSGLAKWCHRVLISLESMSGVTTMKWHILEGMGVKIPLNRKKKKS